MKRLFNRIGVLLLLGALLWPLAFALGQEGEETVSVMTVRAPLHTEPSAQSETLTTLSRGALLTYLGLDEGLTWVQVETADGTVGWISIAHVRLNGPYVPPADGLTRTVVDGRADDWARFTRPFADDAGDSSGAVDILAVRSFMNQGYLYAVIEASGDLRQAQLVLFDIVTNTAGEYRTYQYALSQQRAGTLFVLTEAQGEARDASVALTARDTALEVRLPLDLIDSPDSLNLVAVHVQELVGGGLVTTDELAEVMPTVVTLELEPAVNGAVGGERLNLRAAPVTGQRLRVLAPEESLRLLGRNADGTWLFVRLDDTTLGWVAAEFVETDLDVETLPVEPGA